MEVKINPLCYIKIYKHAKLWAKDDCFIYGLLTGFVEDNIPFIQDYLPLSHSFQQPIDFEMRHDIFHQIDSFNDENYDPDYLSDEIVGWVRSHTIGNFEPSFIDKKNQEYIQTAYCDNAVGLFIPPSADQYEMVLKKFRGELPEIDLTSPFEDVDWNFGELEDIDNLFELIINLQRNRKKKIPLIEEIFEAPLIHVPEGAVEKIT